MFGRTYIVSTWGNRLFFHLQTMGQQWGNPHLFYFRYQGCCIVGADEEGLLAGARLKEAGLQFLITTLPCNKLPFEYSLK